MLHPTTIIRNNGYVHGIKGNLIKRNSHAKLRTDEWTKTAECENQEQRDAKNIRGIDNAESKITCVWVLDKVVELWSLINATSCLFYYWFSNINAVLWM